jgi:bifunctional non-homologous end joining protein LigD
MIQNVNVVSQWHICRFQLSNRANNCAIRHVAVCVVFRALGQEGLVAKRRDSRYEPGLRSGAWRKMRVNRAQDFVIGGYTVGNPFDALVFGYYEGKRLMYAARTRNGFTPASRARLFEKFRGLEISNCPFVNLPELRSGRWGQGLTKEKMADCRWLKPALVGRFEFVEWTPDNHLRHTRFVGLQEHRKAQDVVRESGQRIRRGHSLRSFFTWRLPCMTLTMRSGWDAW